MANKGRSNHKTQRSSHHLPGKGPQSATRYLMMKLEVADALAKEGTKNTVFDVPTFLLIPPVSAQKVVQADTLRTTYVRTMKNCNNIFQGRDVARTITNGTPN
ncbi:uncharacterized protein LOC129872319 [Solanum dulcamara]|uniref:uncharacterized protein LOC129872319 n=1 Tax=Solanum dulcamara TaxID=45834 RepID=UPI002484DD9B|nr:uncharacterized protein LOC129872319 [Solanum dulcamara]